MTRKKWIGMALFLLVAILHIGVPVSLIWAQEQILLNGEPFKFKTRPVDPYDPFRGRYVALDFDAAEMELPAEAIDKTIEYGAPAYATIETDEEGFARFTAVSASPPSTGAYLKVESYWSRWETPKDGRYRVRVGIPFTRYYMNEQAAPEAERAVAANQQAEDSTYAWVRVLNGVGRIEKLYVQDIPIEDFIKQPRPSTE